MSAYAELSAALRGPMREWWRGTGAWLLLAMAVCWGTFILLQVPRLVDPTLVRQSSPALVVGWGTAGLLALVTMMYVWMRAARVAIEAASPHFTNIGEASSKGRLRQVLFVIAIQQGLWPLAMWWFLRLANHVASGVMLYGKEASLAYFLAAIPDTWKGMLYFVPPMLVALAMLTITRQAWTSGLLVGLSWISSGAFEYWPGFIQYATDNEGTPIWAFGLEASVGVLTLFWLFRTLTSERPAAWRWIYGALVVCLSLAPVLLGITLRAWSWPSYLLTLASRSPTFMFSAHDPMWRYFGELTTSSFPVEYTVIGYLAPAVPFLSALLFYSGLFALLYWLLGEPWRGWKGRGVAPEAGLEVRPAR